MQRYIKLNRIGDLIHRKFLCRLIVVNKIKGVARLYRDAVPAQAVSHVKHAAGTDHFYIGYQVYLTLIQHAAANGKLCTNGRTY